jgi:hypothetical protein
MGASSIEASAIVGYAISCGVISSGAGHCVIKVMKHYQCPLREAIKQCCDESFFNRHFLPGGLLNEIIG